MQVEGKSTQNGQKIQLTNKLSVSLSQNVIVSYLNNGYYSLTFEHSKKVIDVPGASLYSQTPLQQYSANESTAQQWMLKKEEDGYYSIVSRCNGLYIDVPGGTASQGESIQLYKGNASDAQRFKFEKVKEITQEKTIEEGLYYISSALSSNKVLTIQDGKTDNFANLQIRDKGIQSQKFQVTYDNNLKVYTITAFHSDKVLDVASGGQTNSTNVQQYQANTSTAQQWIIKRTEDGYYSIISKCNYLYLDLEGGSTSNGTNVQMYEENNSQAQKFQFDKVEEITSQRVLEDGTYKIFSALNNHKVFDVAGGSFENGANLQLWDLSKVQQQKFQVTYHEDGKYYEIMSVCSGKVLDVDSNRKADGSNVWQYESNGSAPQKWALKSAGNDYFYIVAMYSGLYLDVTGAGTANGTNIQGYSGNQSAAQKFKFQKVQMIDDDLYKIEIKQDSTKGLDIQGASKQEGANLQIWSRDNVMQQMFEIQAINATSYKIIAKHSKKVLTVVNQNVVQETDRNKSNQKWTFEVAGNGYYRIKSLATGLYLDLTGGATSNGTNVQIYQGNGTAAQMFKLDKVARKDGIDVSFYQGSINWMEVKNSNYSDFAMIRAGFRGYGSTGSLNTDTQFTRNILGAKANHIPIGLYFFTQAINVQEAVEEANYVLDLVRRYGIDVTYPIAIDTEIANGGLGRADELDVVTRTAVCKAFCDTIRNAGYTPAIYASRDWFYTKLDINQLSSYDIWLAHYTGSSSIETDYQYNYHMWQYTRTGSVNGIVGNVDLNVSYKSY